MGAAAKNVAASSMAAAGFTRMKPPGEPEIAAYTGDSTSAKARRLDLRIARCLIGRN
jgi:hypothetical protein